MTTTKQHLPLSEIGQRVCDIASEQLGIARNKLSLNDRLVEDLRCDSLELVELLMELEEEFQVELPNEPPNSTYKSIFTRQPFRLCHLAELIYLQQGNPPPPQKRLQRTSGEAVEPSTTPFTQLDGRWDRSDTRGLLLELLEVTGQTKIYRRQSDGMRCISVPAALVDIGCSESGPHSDEFPTHRCYLDAFVIDAELVSTTAYGRFLNSVDQVTSADLEAWFVLHPDDHRSEHCLIRRTDSGWRPVFGTEKLPMILVSWYGANAYSLWANGYNWTQYRNDEPESSRCFLPSEAQWEYAARGAYSKRFPWGDGEPSNEMMAYGLHQRGVTYTTDSIPLAAVNENRGMSPFGLHHMAGNVWQWCSDWYDKQFYMTTEASQANAVNRSATLVRSERGGSWIGPAELCRSSYRRGRPPIARGRCLGFRCVSDIGADVGSRDKQRIF